MNLIAHDLWILTADILSCNVHQRSQDFKIDRQSGLEMELPELKEKLLQLEPDEFVNEVIINGACKHVSEASVQYAHRRIVEAMSIPVSHQELVVVGSAKLGYALFEKKLPDQELKPRFRAYSAESDVDFAICSASLFDQIWDELSTFALRKPWMPYRMDKLGDYLVYGWLRPDMVPREARLRTLDSLRDQFRELGTSTHFRRRKLRFALYRGVNNLAKYQTRGIARCRQELTAP